MDKNSVMDQTHREMKEFELDIVSYTHYKKEFNLGAIREAAKRLKITPKQFMLQQKLRFDGAAPAKQLIKEVPGPERIVEKIVEVPVEVIKEVEKIVEPEITECVVCGAPYKTERGYKQHLQLKHPAEYKQIYPEEMN